MVATHAEIAGGLLAGSKATLGINVWWAPLLASSSTPLTLLLFSPYQVGSQEADADRAATQGSYSNNQLDINSPWAHFFSTEFLTSGMYARWQDKQFYNDFALVSDFFRDDELRTDRLWTYLNGHYRPLENLNFHWRTTLDIIGEQNFLWRNAFIDGTWFFTPKQSIDLSFSKYRTLTTAYSFYTYFRPLELQDPINWPVVAPKRQMTTCLKCFVP